MKIMVFDVESQSLPLWSEPSEHPGQPHLCQFTTVLTDADTQQELEYVDMLIKPDGWIIPDEVAAIHGITTEIALADGQPEADAVAAFTAMATKSDLVVGFNVDFDLRLMRIAMLRYGYTKDAVDAFAREQVKKHCAMRQATPICKLPPTERMMAAGRRTFKNPKLSEAVKAILGEEMTDAHDARADVLWTQRLYFFMNPTGRPAK